MAVALPALHVPDPGTRGRARHAGVQLLARRAPSSNRARLPGLARRRGRPHAHRLLRQGAPGRGLQRHLLLVAEPPRRDGAGYGSRDVAAAGPPLRAPAGADKARGRGEAPPFRHACRHDDGFSKTPHALTPMPFMPRSLAAIALPVWLASIAPALAQDAADIVVRLNRLENQARQMAGQIEQLQYENRQLKEQTRKFQEDVEFRFQDSRAGSGSAGSRPAAAPAPSPSQTPSSLPPSSPRPQRRGDAFDPS